MAFPRGEIGRRGFYGRCGHGRLRHRRVPRPGGRAATREIPFAGPGRGLGGESRALDLFRIAPAEGAREGLTRTDQPAGQKHQRAAQPDLQSGRDRRGVHVTVAQPGNDG